jgi:small neutral amino acid transporter SnatA (MarC family)
MNGILLTVAYLAAVNPLRTRLELPEEPSGRARPGVLGAGAVLAVGGVAATAGWSGPLLDLLEVTPETFRLAAGVVLAAAAIVTLFRPRPAPEPEARGALAALWPVLYPRLLGAEVVALALTTGAKEGVAPSVAAAGGALAAVVAAGAMRRTPFADRVLAGLGRLLTVLLTVVALYLIVDGIRDV